MEMHKMSDSTCPCFKWFGTELDQKGWCFKDNHQNTYCHPLLVKLKKEEKKRCLDRNKLACQTTMTGLLATIEDPLIMIWVFFFPLADEQWQNAEQMCSLHFWQSLLITEVLNSGQKTQFPVHSTAHLDVAGFATRLHQMWHQGDRIFIKMQWWIMVISRKVKRSLHVPLFEREKFYFHVNPIQNRSFFLWYVLDKFSCHTFAH